MLFKKLAELKNKSKIWSGFATQNIFWFCLAKNIINFWHQWILISSFTAVALFYNCELWILLLCITEPFSILMSFFRSPFPESFLLFAVLCGHLSFFRSCRDNVKRCGLLPKCEETYLKVLLSGTEGKQLYFFFCHRESIGSFSDGM